MIHRHPSRSQYVEDKWFQVKGTSAKAVIAVGFVARTL
jgi:uncharacterized membrane protein YcgQ (UPF0703/DUF1980 family)